MYVCMVCYVDALKYICNVVFGNWSIFADFEIPSVESEWVVIGGVGRGIHHHWWVRTEQCVHTTGKCVYMFICRCFVGSPHLLSLFSAHSVIDGERNAMFILIFDNQDNQVPFYRQLDNLNTQPIYSILYVLYN